ncbi:MAG: protein kinase [Chitinivibrionales bacterium]|nr:protein kinase [Chitinivibrionales bacterium]MBD3397344.1 protein kinase [Chitinivibrionales bacterium]
MNSSFSERVVQQEKIRIRPDQPSPAAKRAITLPDGHSPTPLGSGLVTKVISTGGGMAVIYEIWNPDLEIKRAVKLLRPDHTQESEERFQTEMKICAKLHHSNIVEIYAVGTWNTLPYIEMEEIEGYTVEKLLATAGSLPVEVCTSIGIMVGRALNYAHNQKYMLYGKEYQGVIHRDLKPSNIMVPSDGIVKLMDFGIATPTSASIHTMEGTVVGTLQYLSPEQLEGKEIDVRVDIYSLGTVMYEMLTGVRAFPEANLAKLVPDKLNNRYTPLESYKVRIPRPLRELVHRCMRHEKERRIGNALEFLRALGKIHKGLTSRSPEQVMRRFMQEPPSEKTVINTRRRRNIVPALLWSATALAFALAIALGTYYIVLARRNRYEMIVSEEYGGQETEAVSGESGKETSEDAASGRQDDDEGMRPAGTRPLQRATGRANERSRAVRRPRDAAQSANARRAGGDPAQARQEQPEDAGAVAAPPRQPTLLERLQRKHGTRDASRIFEAEVEEGNFKSALAVYRSIPAGQTAGKKTVLYRLRALKGAGRTGEANKLLRGSDVADGEFYLEKAMANFAAKNFGAAQQNLTKASTTPVAFMDQDVFRGKLLHAKGLCASGLFDAGPSEKAKKEAMSAWFEVKSHFRRLPQHAFYKKADEEIRRINKVAMPE